MKKLKKIILILIPLFVISCDFLDQEPVSYLSQHNMWKSYRDVQAGVNDIYFNFRSTMRYNFFNWGELRADNFEMKTPGSGETDKLISNILSSDLTYTSWTQLYKTINSANAAIKHIPDADIPVEEDKKDFLAQAYAMRALCYFYGIRVWGDVPVYLTPTEDVDNMQYSHRISKDSVLNNVILPDLIKAESLIKVTNRERKRISKNAIWAIMADVYLWMKDYNNVVITVDKFNSSIGTSGTFQFEPDIFKLASIFHTDLDNKPSDKNDESDEYGYLKEILFVIHFNKREWDFSSWTWSLFGGGSPGLVKLSENISAELIKPEHTNDLRLRLFTREGGMTKYIPEGANVSYSVWSECQIAYPVYRTTELYLMKAEALAYLSRWDEALNIIRENIRKRAGGGTTSSALYTSTKVASDFATLDELIDYIQNEKRLEMVGEGKRWFDLVRTNRWKNLSKFNKGGTAENPLVPEYQKLFPIHFVHVDENPDYIQQNTGY